MLSTSAKLVGLITACILLLWVDPYSYGGRGIAIGEFVPIAPANTGWQQPAAIALAGLLVVGVAAARFDARAGMLVLVLEGVAYVAINVAFFVRDGSGRIADAGYVNQAIGFEPFVGLVLRMLAMRALMRSRENARTTAGGG